MSSRRMSLDRLYISLHSLSRFYRFLKSESKGRCIALLSDSSSVLSRGRSG